MLSEIQSCMEDPKYSVQLSYFNSSAGVMPIVNKLPFHIQGKWINQATKFKKANNVIFPPFTVFCEFIKEMSSMLNDPGLTIFTDTRETAERKGARASGGMTFGSRQMAVTVRKTDVKQEPTQKVITPGNCPIHHTRHSLNQCRTFRNKTMADRKRFLREHNMCYRCCETDNHIFKNCTATVKCLICSNTHHPTALHSDYRQDGNNLMPYKTHGREAPYEQSSSKEENPSKKSVASLCTNVCGKEFFGRSCAKIVLVKVYPGNKVEKAKKMYAILDDQSNRTLGRPDFFDKMEVKNKSSEQYTLVSCAGTVHTEGRFAHGLTVATIDDSFSFALPNVFECNEIPNTRSVIPTPEIIVLQTF